MANQKVKWVNIEKDKLKMLITDMKRYRVCFRILFGYLIFDLIQHLGWLEL
jgi:hypothetical protein